MYVENLLPIGLCKDKNFKTCNKNYDGLYTG